jgi:para-nitrobenzyl esterase
VFGESVSAPRQSEECLFLNVWTPSPDGQRRPVMVWLHGGGLTAGSGSGALSDGAKLAARGDVVIVSVNHRIGLFGFLHLGDHVEDERFRDSSCVGIQDLVAALEWVRDNIGEFGGDPSNVTIFGSSGGAVKACFLLGVPEAEGLFHRAIVMSGPALCGLDRTTAALTTSAIFAALPVESPTIEELQALPVEELLAAQTQALVPFATPHALGPVSGGDVLPLHPFQPTASPSSLGVPMLLGTTQDEMSLFLAAMLGGAELTQDALPFAVAGLSRLSPDVIPRLIETYSASRPSATPFELATAITTDVVRLNAIALAERRVESAAEPTYMYVFAYETDQLDARLKATHGMDVPFVFGTLDVAPLAGGRPDRYALVDLMTQAWTSFARTGVPLIAGAETWPAYDLASRKTMILNAEAHLVSDPGRDERAAWGFVPPLPTV